MIYTKTELGKTALHDKSLALTPRQRSAFIMFDGKRASDDVLKLTTALGVTAEDINRLVTLGLLAAGNAAPVAGLPETVTVSAPSLAPVVGAVSPEAPKPALSNQDQYAKAYPIAVRLTSNLGLRGFRLNLSVESAGDLEAQRARRLRPHRRPQVPQGAPRQARARDRR